MEHKNLFGLKVRSEIANLACSDERSRAVSYVDRRDGRWTTRRISICSFRVDLPAAGRRYILTHEHRLSGQSGGALEFPPPGRIAGTTQS